MSNKNYACICKQEKVPRISTTPSIHYYKTFLLFLGLYVSRHILVYIFTHFSTYEVNTEIATRSYISEPGDYLFSHANKHQLLCVNNEKQSNMHVNNKQTLTWQCNHSFILVVG